MTAIIAMFSGGGCQPEDARSLETRSALLEIREGLSRFYKDMGRYPTDEEHLSSLVTGHEMEGWNGPYLSEARLIDPWRNPYFYGIIRHLIYVASSGPNRKPETNQSDLLLGLSRGDDLVILMPNIDQEKPLK